MKRLIALAFAAMITLLPSFAAAGSSEAGEAILPAHEVAAFSNKVQQELAAKGARVAIVARTGRDPADLPDGIRYTHVAYWVYSHITLENGEKGFGYRAYNLYQTSEDLTVSKLVQDSPADFFAGAYKLDAGIIIPDERLQDKLLATIASPSYAKLHNANYSVLANPADPRFQNCTEHTLDVLMASLYGTDNRMKIKANIAAHFTPQQIEIGGFKRMLAPVASGDLRTSDHGSDVGTATFSTIGRFMVKYDLADDVFAVTPSGKYRL
ncbi:DUF2145 domain-containing protein [Alphaproteobacteria bacterium GH1-50]|uniref:DUF2145 domain-containing protein n=1 Tax=Kangsaoukella pontilimi TaxID=2691042 RepID=A0A7C9IGW9_9RHOB|nr:DUF2145 domain-containing protein [Kangsaoukella pontilimi]MXQ08608.1 DUF2145 domain-containing protein [Kangsaoukella pontilimi]